MQPPKSEICVICGVNPATTMDHLPPRSFFTGVENAQLYTVPACASCNNGASHIDEDLRFYCSIQIGNATSSSSALFNRAYKGYARKPDLRKDFEANLGYLYVATEEGGLERRLATKMRADTFIAGFERITRGLYFYFIRSLLPPTTPVRVDVLHTDPQADIWSSFTTHTVGENVFRVGYLKDSTNLHSTVWLYSFYGVVHVAAYTGSAAEHQSF